MALMEMMETENKNKKAKYYEQTITPNYHPLLVLARKEQKENI